jgi:uncharacterized protein YbjQ (UPF0145 family)
LSALAAASARAEDDALSRLPPPAIQWVYPGAPIDKAVAEALQPIRTYDIDGDGLDAADVNTAEAIALARQRSPLLARYLYFDLDGDLEFTEREVRTTMRGDFHGRSDSEVAQVIAQIMVVDRNHDDVVSLGEIYAAAALDWHDQTTFRQLRQLLAADPDGNGRVTLGEIEGLVRAALGGVDANGNGLIDEAEYAAKELEILRAHVAAFNPDCRLPKAAEGEELIRAFFSNGLAQPTVTVAGQDRETSLARITIEPGDRRLYLLLSAYDMILKFEGATTRLKHVVIMGPSRSDVEEQEIWAGTGIVGISRDLVTFLPAAACAMQSDSITEESTERENRMIAAAIEANTPIALGANAVEGISLPSGRTINPQQDTDVMVTADGTYVVKAGEAPKKLEGGLTPEFQEQWLAKSGGIVELYPRDVFSSGRVETYEVLPGQEGLKRLVETGFLERTRKGYRLLKPIPRWPAGLNGAHPVTVFVPRGMPLPKDGAGVSIVTEP